MRRLLARLDDPDGLRRGEKRNRARRRNTSIADKDENRFESENREFFQRVHQAYLAIARREERMVKVDARRSISVVHKEIVAIVEKRLLEKKPLAVSR